MSTIFHLMVDNKSPETFEWVIWSSLPTEQARIRERDFRWKKIITIIIKGHSTLQFIAIGYFKLRHFALTKTNIYL